MKTSSWALCAAAVLAGDMGLHMITTQPMAERVESLSGQVSHLQSAIDRLTVSAGNAMQANDLLSNLAVQGKRAQEARQAIEQIRRFEREVRSQGHAVGHSMNLVQNIGRLHQEIITQGQEIKALNASLDDLSAFQQQVHGLTSAASREYVGVDRATQLVRELGQLKQDVAAQANDIEIAIDNLEQLAALKQRAAQEANGIEQANDSLEQLAALKQRASREADGIAEAAQSLNQLGELKERVAMEADGVEMAETQFSRLIGLKKSLEIIDEQDFAIAQSHLAQFADLRDMILQGARGVGEAIGFSQQLLSMQDELVERGGRIDVARKHADGLLSLEDALANDAHLNIGLAQENLNGLVAIERQLSSQDDRIVAAVESLELMKDLQEEFVRRIGDLQGLRAGLTELAMMESSIMRTVRSLQPLVELTNLRRLNGEDLQAVARGLMDRRTSRMAASDPSDLPLGNDFRSASGNGSEERLVPIPPTRQ